MCVSPRRCSYPLGTLTCLLSFCCSNVTDSRLIKMQPLPAFSIQFNCFFSVELFTNWQVLTPLSSRIRFLGVINITWGAVFKVLCDWVPTHTYWNSNFSPKFLFVGKIPGIINISLRTSRRCLPLFCYQIHLFLGSFKPEIANLEFHAVIRPVFIK